MYVDKATYEVRNQGVKWVVVFIPGPGVGSEDWECHVSSDKGGQYVRDRAGPPSVENAIRHALRCRRELEELLGVVF